MTGSLLPVLVVGAGPTGVAVASLLGADGIECLVVDRWPDPWPQPRAVHLDDEVCRVLGRIGVGQGFARISRPALGLRLLDPQHRVMAEFARSPEPGVHGWPAANLFDQPELEGLMRDNLGRFGSVALRGGVEVLGLTQHDEHVLVDLQDRRTGEREQVAARWVLGCDGAGSLVRDALGVRLRDLGFSQRWLVVDVDTDAELGTWAGVHQVCDPERAATYLQVTGRRHRWELRLRDGESAEELARPERLLPLLRPWTGDTPDEALTVVRAAEYVFRAAVADRWRDRRVLLLGDAAHLTPPFIGQGVGAGIRDAQNLAWRLSGVLRGRLAEEVLDGYQRERAPHVRALVRTAVVLGRVMTQGGETGTALRGLLVPRLRWVPGLRQRVLSSRTPRLRGLGTHPLAGTLCPNAPLPDGRRFDEAQGGRTLLVSLDPVPGDDVLVVDRDSPLGRWLRRGLSRWALVRPDGTVERAGRRISPRL